MVEARRFPPPWTAEETDACFIVRDHNGQALAYVYLLNMSRLLCVNNSSTKILHIRLGVSIFGSSRYNCLHWDLDDFSLSWCKVNYLFLAVLLG